MSKARNYVIPIFHKEMSILETVYELGPCTSAQVKESLKGNHELLLVMRTLHNLVEKRLLERVVIDGQRLYRTRSNFKNIRTYLKMTGE
jgi:hypothetical protein